MPACSCFKKILQASIERHNLRKLKRRSSIRASGGKPANPQGAVEATKPVLSFSSEVSAQDRVKAPPGQHSACQPSACQRVSRKVCHIGGGIKHLISRGGSQRDSYQPRSSKRLKRPKRQNTKAAKRRSKSVSTRQSLPLPRSLPQRRRHQASNLRSGSQRD